MKSFPRFSPQAIILIYSLILITLDGIAGAQRGPLISGPIDSSSRVQLLGSQPHLASALDLGSLEETARLERMVLVLGVPPEEQRQLETLLDSQHTKGATNYQRRLTPEEFGQHFGPHPDDV